MELKNSEEEEDDIDMNDESEIFEAEEIEKDMEDTISFIEEVRKKVPEKLEADDKEKLDKAVQDTLNWLNSNRKADLKQFDAKRKEFEGIVNPILEALFPT